MSEAFKPNSGSTRSVVRDLFFVCLGSVAWVSPPVKLFSEADREHERPNRYLLIALADPTNKMRGVVMPPAAANSYCVMRIDAVDRVESRNNWPVERVSVPSTFERRGRLSASVRMDINDSTCEVL